MRYADDSEELYEVEKDLSQFDNLALSETPPPALDRMRKALDSRLGK